MMTILSTQLLLLKRGQLSSQTLSYLWLATCGRLPAVGEEFDFSQDQCNIGGVVRLVPYFQYKHSEEDGLVLILI